MSNDSVLAKLDIAKTALLEAKTIQETKKILDVAIAAEILAKRQKMGEEAINYATSIKVEALRQLGFMLKETERAKGGEQYHTTGNSEEPVLPTLSDLGLDKKTSKLAQDVASLSEEKLEKVKQGVISLSKATNVHVSNNSGENEWYTPGEYIEAALKTMGSIDCDPASSDKANKIIQAKKYFTKEQDGLKQKWEGNVWMNPPYSQPLIDNFSEAITKKFIKHEIDQACILVNNATETNWFQRMLVVASCVCFIKGRIKFIDPDGNPNGAPLQGQAILYFGSNKENFYSNFKSFGIILWKKPEEK